MKIVYSFLVFIAFNSFAFAQEKALNVIKKDTLTTKINPLAPSTAAFYSAVLPGLGQAYNKKYWKIPIVYAAIGSSIYVYSLRNKEYNSLRDAYKLRLQGTADDFPFFNDTQLIQTMNGRKKERDLMLMVTIGVYALNILDAVVDAHLKDFNVNEKLTFYPTIQKDIYNANSFALALTYKF